MCITGFTSSNNTTSRDGVQIVCIDCLPSPRPVMAMCSVLAAGRFRPSTEGPATEGVWARKPSAKSGERRCYGWDTSILFPCVISHTNPARRLSLLNQYDVACLACSRDPHVHLHPLSTGRVSPLRHSLGRLLVGRDYTRYHADPPLQAKLSEV